MISINTEEVVKIQKKYAADLKRQKVKALGGLRAIDTDDVDERDYLNSIINIFRCTRKDIITLKIDELEVLKERVGEFTLGKEFKNKILKALGYSDLRSSFYPKYFNDIGIKACVYCNSQLTIVARKNEKGELSAKFQVDHYIPKDKYPFLSISLFNLYPSCASCNVVKRVKEVNFSLYKTHPKGKVISSDFKFSLEPNIVSEYLLHKNKEDIEISFEEPEVEDGFKTFEDTFHIQGIYNTQKDLVEELIVKSQMYNEKYIDTLQSSFSSLKLNPSLFKRTIVGNYTEDKDIHKRPMSKFTMDIARQLGLIDKIK
ncbi:hypothetical protein [Myroides odoratimimus]|uniref:HNH endonuclease n=1 Tax=Myroides odoratimimus TaxID=76832 RepID=UPI003101A956